jgi:hypothetical protein
LRSIVNGLILSRDDPRMQLCDSNQRDPIEST